MSAIATAALLAANAFFVALEFALIASRRTKLQPLAEAGDRRARAAMRATGALDFELAGAQLGVTMSSLGLGFVAEPAISRLLEAGLRHLAHLPPGVVHTVGFLVALSFVSFLHMVVGEMVPKNITIAAPERTLLWLALPNRLYVVVFGPAIRVLNAAANGCIRLLGARPREQVDTVHNAEEIAVLLHESLDKGLLEQYEHELLAGALGFGEQPIARVMVPWERVITIGRGATVAELERTFVEHGRSRVPVVGPDGRSVLGFLHAKDLLSLPAVARERPIPLGRMRRMLIIQPDRTLADTLVTMQRARLHMAVVVDAGVPVGLVTLEDVLEELVGDIRDESDRFAAKPRRPQRVDGGAETPR